MVRLGLLTSLLATCLWANAAYVPYVRKVARVTFTGTSPSVNNELKGHWVASVSRTLLGNTVLTVEPNTFGAAPICFCMAEVPAVGCNANPTSATSITVRMHDLTPTALALLGVDTTFVISCEYSEGG